MNLDEAKVLVTGGSSGIGEVTARLLVSESAQVAICGHDAGKLKRVADDIGV